MNLPEQDASLPHTMISDALAALLSRMTMDDLREILSREKGGRLTDIEVENFTYIITLFYTNQLDCSTKEAFLREYPDLAGLWDDSED